jgi:hypothetical protein
MLDRKEISRFVGDELIQVNQAIKEDAHVLEALFEVWNVEVALLVMRLHHVI